MRITVVNHTLGKRAQIELDASSTLEELLVLAEVEMGDPFPPNQLASLAGGTSGAVFVADKPLSEQGLIDGATVNVMPPGTAAPTATLSPTPAAPVAPSAEEQLRRLFGNSTPATAPAATAATSSSAAAESDPAEQIRRLFAGGGGGGATRQQPPQRGGGRRMQRPPLDPMDPEYQKKMYERIQEENMLANLEQAMEHTPEAFGRVEMLYVTSHVNKEPITAFVDSGAQMTIMNEATAERCGILRLLDRRAAGVAKGVGTAEILGRIHMAMVNLGGIHLPMSITVLKEQSMEFLIGLDQLKTHQMCIDLKRNVLQISDTVSLPFLSEGELPKHMRSNRNGAEEDDEAAQKAITESLKDVKPNSTTTTTTSTSAPAAPRATSVVAESEDNDAPVNNTTPTTQPSTAATTAAPSSGRTPTQEAAIREVVAATGVPSSVAINALEAVGWDANAAVGILLGD